jgi:hypothetical protein
MALQRRYFFFFFELSNVSTFHGIVNVLNYTLS